MKNVQQHLIRLGALMGAKYASIDANIIKNDVKDAIWPVIRVSYRLSKCYKQMMQQ
jgi:hypothetical protein